MSMDYLGAMVPPRSRRAHFGAALNLSFIAPLAPAEQTGRLYSAFRQGGGVLFSEDAAERMSARGFAVRPVKLTERERRYLGGLRGSEVGEQGWIATCEGAVVAVEVGNGHQLHCQTPGFERIPVDDAVDQGLANTESMSPAYRWGKEVGEWRAYLPTVEPSMSRAQYDQARSMVRWYDATGVLVEKLARIQSVTRVPFPPALQTVYEASASWMGKWAQPVEIFKEGDPEGSYQGTAFGAPVWVVPTIYVAGAILIVGGLGYSFYASAQMLASQSTAAYNVHSDLMTQYYAAQEELRECMTDSSLPEGVRASCRDNLMALAPPADPPDPFGDFTKSMEKLAKAAVPVVAIGATIYLAGPFVRELSKAGGRRLAKI